MSQKIRYNDQLWRWNNKYDAQCDYRKRFMLFEYSVTFLLVFRISSWLQSNLHIIQVVFRPWSHCEEWQLTCYEKNTSGFSVVFPWLANQPLKRMQFKYDKKSIKWYLVQIISEIIYIYKYPFRKCTSTFEPPVVSRVHCGMFMAVLYDTEMTPKHIFWWSYILAKKIVYRSSHTNMIGLTGHPLVVALHLKAGKLDIILTVWPSDAIWRHRSAQTLAQVIGCCLTAPNDYLNLCLLIINEI